MLLKSALFAFATASHFRSGSFQFSQDTDNPDDLILTRTLNYRRGFSGYTPACTKPHVRKAKRSNTMEYEHCLLERDNSTCGVYSATYIVNDIENQGFLNSQWCYGYVDDKVSKPAEPFEYYFQNCCWVDLTDDDGTVITDGYFKLYAKFNDVDNNSPQVKVPPIWRIMTGCPDQRLHLNPSDKDGDTIRCRWSTKDEAKDGYHLNGNFESLKLDEESCIVTYDGTKDIIQGGVKPVAIHVEDFDANGNVKSSIPVQFLATVWQPKETGRNITIGSRHDRLDQSEAFYWGDIFSNHDHHDDGMHYRTRRDTDITRARKPSINPNTGNPYYCDEPPQLIHPSPKAGEELLVTGEVKIDLASYYMEDTKPMYDLKRYQYNSPQGMDCTPIDSTNGRAQCTWLPTLEQKKQMLHDFCFLAIDKYGRDTERRCITLKIVNVRDDVHSLLDLIAPEFAYRATNDYGCAGRGSLDPFVANAGPPIDAIDGSINQWKYCIRCAADVLTDGDAEIPKYKYNENDRICLNPIGTIKRSICECDHQLAHSLSVFPGPNKKYQDYPIKNCQPPRRGSSNEHPACCQTTEGFFKFYFGSKSCCNEDGNILSIGECMTDHGRPYKAKITITRPEYIHVGDAGGKGTSGTTTSGNSGNGSGKGNKNKDPNKWASEGGSEIEGNL